MDKNSSEETSVIQRDGSNSYSQDRYKLLKERAEQLKVRRRFDSPMRQGIFFPGSTFSADCLSVFVPPTPTPHPPVQKQALTSVRTLKIL